MTAASHTLDLTTIAISPLRDEFDLSRFCCGEQSLDSYITRRLKKAQSDNRVKVFCAHPRNSNSVYGLYHLSIIPVDAKFLMEEESKIAVEKHFHGIYLGTLAVLRHYHGQKLGTFLLMDALRRSYYVSQNVAIFGVALKSINNSTTELYKKYGFGLRNNDQQPLMVLPIWTLNELIEKTKAK